MFIQSATPVKVFCASCINQNKRSEKENQDILINILILDDKS